MPPKRDDAGTDVSCLDWSPVSSELHVCLTQPEASEYEEPCVNPLRPHGGSLNARDVCILRGILLREIVI